MQVAPFSQSLSSQSSMLVWQVGPSKPSGHVQLQQHTTRSTHYIITLSSSWDKYDFNPWLHRFQSSSPSPVHSLLLLVHLAGSSVGTRVAHAGVQSRLTVLALRRRTETVFTFCHEICRPQDRTSQTGSDLESWRTAAPVYLHQVAVTDALVQTGTGQTGVTLGQHGSVHISYGKMPNWWDWTALRY